MAGLPSWSRRLFVHEQVQCLACGDCCRQFGWHLRASERDLARWRELGRQDLLERVNRLGWIWVDPDTKEPLGYCPYLVETESGKAHCSIHEIKPDMCRDYPPEEQFRICLHGIYQR